MKVGYSQWGLGLRSCSVSHQSYNLEKFLDFLSISLTICKTGMMIVPTLLLNNMIYVKYLKHNHIVKQLWPLVATITVVISTWNITWNLKKKKRKETKVKTL